MLKVRNLGRQALGQLTESVGFTQFDKIDLDGILKVFGALRVNHHKALQGIVFVARLAFEQVKVEQVDADDGLGFLIIRAGVELLAVQTREVHHGALDPKRFVTVAKYLFFSA